MIEYITIVSWVSNMKTNDYLIEKIEKLLNKYASNEESQKFLSNHIAQKSILMNHLYEDLGLDSRDEMNKLMGQNFNSLAQIKPPSIRWKKFLFDMIGEVAPACRYCYDQTNCFGCELKINTGDEFSQMGVVL